MQLMNLGREATFEELSMEAIAADQQFSLRTRLSSRREPASSENGQKESELIEQFKRLLNIIEARHVDNNIQPQVIQNQSPPQNFDPNFSVNMLQSSSQHPQYTRNQYQNSSQGYQVQNRPRPVVCFRCGMPGHYRNACRQFPSNYPMYPQYAQYQNIPNSGNMYAPQAFQNQQIHQEPNNVSENTNTCGLCGLGGHSPNECPRNISTTSGVMQVCQLCDAIGHSAKNCIKIVQDADRKSESFRSWDDPYS